jgi:prevent-host-death family protein
MQTFTANEAKTRFGEFLDRAQREPVRVMRHDRMVGVMVSAEDYEAMRSFSATDFSSPSRRSTCCSGFTFSRVIRPIRV